MKKEIKLISDFNFDLFYNFLNNKLNEKEYKIYKPTYELFSNGCYRIINSKSKYHTIVAWSRIEKVLEEFSNLMNFKNVSLKKLNNEVDNYIDLILKLSEKSENLIVTSWTLPYLHRGYYLQDFTNDFGLTKNLYKINLKIAEEFKKKSNIHFFNIDFLLQKNFNTFDPRLWYTSKIPYNNKLFEVASDDFSEIIEAFSKSSKKLLILDLDNTLWGGNIGDLGWKKVILGGHDYLGEAFQDFQSKIKSLKNKGIQLAIISKNDEKVALEAFKKNKEMILKIEDFASWKINWDDKAKNLLKITKELNLSPDACVFIDDNINERNRIKTAIPDVLVPDLPEDPSFYVDTLFKLNCFNKSDLTKEDQLRTKFYKDEKKREKAKKNFISHAAWLKSLKIKVKFEKVNSDNKIRVLQLINKTNQMNLTTRRLNENQLQKIILDKKTEIKALRVSDKLGDMGLVGIYVIKFAKKETNVLDFILSCRAFGRSIENLMVYHIFLSSKKNKSKKINFKYFKTKKNKPCLDFLKKLNLKKNGTNRYIYNFDFKLRRPQHLI